MYCVINYTRKCNEKLYFYRVKEAENERLQNIKKEIEEEEKKIRRLKQKKCLEIEMGRKLALSTAELRNEIRSVKIFTLVVFISFLVHLCVLFKFIFLDGVRKRICLINNGDTRLCVICIVTFEDVLVLCIF